MSLDVYLGENGETVYRDNITHNLGDMAKAADVYMPLWRPDEIKIAKAHQLKPLLIRGLATLLDDPDGFKRFNPANGWGDYDGLVSFMVAYAKACAEHPSADVAVWR
jgi:hypothetical protein